VALHLDLEPRPTSCPSPRPSRRVARPRRRSRRSRARRHRPRRRARPPRAWRRPIAARRASALSAHRPPPVALHLDLSSRPHSRPSPQTESTSYAASPSISSQSRTLLHAAPTISPSASAASARCRTPSERPSRSQATASGTAPRSRNRAPLRAQAQDRADGPRGLAADLAEAVRAATGRAGELAFRERSVGSMPHASRATPRASRRPPPAALHLDLSSRHSRPSPQIESTSYAASPSTSSQSRTPLHAAPTISPSASAASARCRTPSERPSRSQATASGTAPRSRARTPLRAQAQDRADGSRGLAADLVEALLAATGRAGELALRERGVGSLPHAVRAPLALAPAGHLQWHFIRILPFRSFFSAGVAVLAVVLPAPTSSALPSTRHPSSPTPARSSCGASIRAPLTRHISTRTISPSSTSPLRMSTATASSRRDCAVSSPPPRPAASGKSELRSAASRSALVPFALLS